MASSKDMRDIMGLPVDGPLKPPPAKRIKTSTEKRPSGISREVAALMGERAPPVSVQDAKKTYQPKARWGNKLEKVGHWSETEFTNPARSDNLRLKHWRRRPALRPIIAVGNQALEHPDEQEFKVETDYEFAKYNIQLEVPQYTEAQYNEHLCHDDWTKDETDYLIDTIRDFEEKWFAIYDRYEFAPKDGSAPKPRTMEELKARYYTVRAKCMELKTPIAMMNPQEFNLHEILTKWDAVAESNHKRLALALFSRTADEVQEEENLLTNIQRINSSFDRLNLEREELRERLSAPPSLGNTSTTQFQSSAALSQLFSQLVQQDRSKKRVNMARLSLNANDMMAGGSGQHTSAGPGHRDSLASVATQQSAQRKASQSQPPTQIRNIPPTQHARFGIQVHDRVSSGVSFASDRLAKLRQAKSVAQAMKLNDALTQLGVPEIIPLPTVRVAAVFERLINKTMKLLDVRKVHEKEEGELRVAREIKAQKEKEEQVTTAEDIDAEGEADGEADAEGEADADGEADAEGDILMGDDLARAPAAMTQGAADSDRLDAGFEDRRPGSSGATRDVGAEDASGHRRSTSVLSAASNKSSRKMKK